MVPAGPPPRGGHTPPSSRDVGRCRGRVWPALWLTGVLCAVFPRRGRPAAGSVARDSRPARVSAGRSTAGGPPKERCVDDTAAGWRGGLSTRALGPALCVNLWTAARHAVWARAGRAALVIPRPRPPRGCGILRELRAELRDSWVSDVFPSSIALCSFSHLHWVSSIACQQDPPSIDQALWMSLWNWPRVPPSISIVAAGPPAAPLPCAALAPGSRGYPEPPLLRFFWCLPTAVAAARPPPARGARQSVTGSGGGLFCTRPRPSQCTRGRDRRGTGSLRRRVQVSLYTRPVAGDGPRRRRATRTPPPAARRPASGLLAVCQGASRPRAGRRVPHGCARLPWSSSCRVVPPPSSASPPGAVPPSRLCWTCSRL